MKLSLPTSLGLAAIALAGPIQDRQEESQALRSKDLDYSKMSDYSAESEQPMRVILQVNKVLSQASVVASSADRSEVYGQACSTKLESGMFAGHPISFDVDGDGRGTITIGAREYIVHENPEVSGGISCDALSSPSEVLLSCTGAALPRPRRLRPLAQRDLAACFAEPLSLEAALAGLDRGASAPPPFSAADQAFNMTQAEIDALVEADADAVALARRQYGCAIWTPSTRRVGDGNPHQNPYHAQLSGNLDCRDGACAVTAFSYESRKIEYRISQGARLTSWITAGFRVTHEVATGNAMTCKATRDERVCVWKKVYQTAYTVENVLLPPCGNNVKVTSDPFVLWSPNAYQPDDYYCVRGVRYCRGIGQGWLDTDPGQPGGPR